MFKKGVITDEISQDIKIAVELALKYNLDGVEIRSVWEKGPHELEPADIARIKNILADMGLAVCGISAPFFKCDIDNGVEIKQHIDILRKCIHLAHELDTDFVRGFTFWKKGGFDENLERIISCFEEPVRLLEREGKTLVLESEPSVFASNADKLAKVVKTIDSAHVRALWDPGNGIYDPENEVPYPDGYKMIKPYMAHMHLKDAKKHHDGRISGVPIGEGDVDYRGQFGELIDSGYKGYVVLETHYRPKHHISSELLALPKGSAFSYMGYEATEECLIKWGKMMENARKQNP